MTDPALRVERLGVTVHGAPVVRDVSFEIAPGQVLGLVGESGAGKSLTALAIMGLLPDGAEADGSVELAGEQLLGRTDRELSLRRGRDIAMVFQESALNPVQRIGGQIAEAIRIHHRAIGRRAALSRAAELLAAVGIEDPANRALAFPHQLSGGMRQRVMIAMAVANDPAVLIADEPTSALDATISAEVLEVLRRARELTGAALLLVTHDLGAVAGHADRVAVMRDGRVVESAGVDELFAHPRADATVELLRAVPDPRAAGAAGRGWSPGDREPLLRIEGLRHHYRGPRGRLRRGSVVRAVDGIDLAVHAGETVALVGESGSGKSTTVSAILELRAPQAGAIVIDGRDTRELDDDGRRRLRARIQPVLQDSADALDPRFTVGAVVAEALTATGRPATLDRVERLLAMVGLTPPGPFADRYPSELSGGQRQRVGIARALATEPELLILDEPVSALDVTVRAEILALVEDLRDRLGLSCLLVAHDLTVVRRIADTVAVMYLGRIVETGPADAVLGAPAHPYTRALLSAVPIPDPARERARAKVLLADDPPPPQDVSGDGCRFAGRCPVLRRLSAEEDRELCRTRDPAPRQFGRTLAACHHLGENVGGST